MRYFTVSPNLYSACVGGCDSSHMNAVCSLRAQRGCPCSMWKQERKTERSIIWRSWLVVYYLQLRCVSIGTVMCDV